MRSAWSADALLLPPAPPASAARVRARPPGLATASDGLAAADALPPVASEARARSPVAWRAAAKPAAGVAPASTASLKPASSEGALRNLAVDGEFEELIMHDVPQRTASSASLAPSTEAADDESDGDEDEEGDASAWPPTSAGHGHGRARVALISPRSAPIAVHRPPAGSAAVPHRGSYGAFNWRTRAPDAAADALSGGAFMPPQWRGDAVDDADEPAVGGLSSSLPPLRALALRDCILRRTGFIENEESPPPSAQLPKQG